MRPPTLSVQARSVSGGGSGLVAAGANSVAAGASDSVAAGTNSVDGNAAAAGGGSSTVRRTWASLGAGPQLMAHIGQPMPIQTGLQPMSLSLSSAVSMTGQPRNANPNAPVPSDKRSAKFLPGAVQQPPATAGKFATGGRGGGQANANAGGAKTFSWQPIKFPVYKK